MSDTLAVLLLALLFCNVVSGVLMLIVLRRIQRMLGG